MKIRQRKRRMAPLFRHAARENQLRWAFASGRIILVHPMVLYDLIGAGQAREATERETYDFLRKPTLP